MGDYRAVLTNIEQRCLFDLRPSRAKADLLQADFKPLTTAMANWHDEIFTNLQHERVAHFSMKNPAQFSAEINSVFSETADEIRVRVHLL